MQDSLDRPDTAVERYELREQPTYQFAANRREFTQILGAGVIVAVSASRTSGQTRGRQAHSAETLSHRFHLGDDGSVTVLTSKVEVGQGSRTQITQAVAEELRLPINLVRVVMADTELCPDDGGTAGSRTTPSTIPRIRSAAAALRDLLISAAAARFGVTADKISFADGDFRSGPDSVSLAKLASDPGLAQQLETAPASSGSVRPVDDWQILGSSAPKVGGREVVTGLAKFPADIQRPGMLYGKVLRPPSYAAELESIDLNAVDSTVGARAVRDGNFVGCFAPTSWQAGQAVDALASTATWNQQSQHVASDGLFAHLKQTAISDGRNRDHQWGDRIAASSAAAERIKSQYTIAYIQHAPMEPRSAVAQWDTGRLTVWTGSQQPSRVQAELCQTFRLTPEKVRVIIPDTGGGFGGKHTGEAAVECARLAKAAGKPVSLRWTREEEFTWAYFRPAGLIEVIAGIDKSGSLKNWEFTNYNSGGSAIATPYRVPNGITSFKRSDSPLRQGSYRALASVANTFARESAMDELAELAKADPLEFRLRHLDDGRLSNVLSAAAAQFGWASRMEKLPASRGIGLACGTEKGSFVAACAEVEVVDGKARVLEVCQAFECGAVQNPKNLRAQHSGALIMGLGGALFEQIEFAEGRIANPAFSSYRVPRISDVPKLDLVQLDRRDLPSVGAGETPIIAVAPAIANAWYRASGIRDRSLPLRSMAVA